MALVMAIPRAVGGPLPPYLPLRHPTAPTMSPDSARSGSQSTADRQKLRLVSSLGAVLVPSHASRSVSSQSSRLHRSYRRPVALPPPEGPGLGTSPGQDAIVIAAPTPTVLTNDKHKRNSRQDERSTGLIMRCNYLTEAGSEREKPPLSPCLGSRNGDSCPGWLRSSESGEGRPQREGENQIASGRDKSELRGVGIPRQPPTLRELSDSAGVQHTQDSSIKLSRRHNNLQC